MTHRLERTSTTLARVAAVLLATTAAFAQSDVFDGTATDVWVLGPTGTTKASYNAGGTEWTEAAIDLGGGAVEIQYTSGATTINFVDTADDVVFVNQTEGSLPAATAAVPSVSVAGIARSLTDIADPTKPGISLIPEPGTYTETIELVLTGVEAPGGSGTLSLHWRIDGGTEQIVTAAEHTFYIVDDGTFSIEFWAEQGGVESTHETESYTLNAAAGPRRDTDGDGIPDKWEDDNGLNPLEDDIAVDSDGDGWSDFDELIRGSDPNDASSVPLDTDGDGWADYDEARRGTNPNDVQLDFPDAPVATRLTEVELLASGDVWTDDAMTIAQTDMSALTVLDVNWNVLYDQADLPTATELAALGLGEGDIPVYLRASVVDAALTAGDLPTLRLPAGDSAVLRARHLDGTGEPDCWVGKSWLDAIPDVTPAEVTDYLAGLGTPWNTPAEWEQGYADYLDATLVQSLTVELFPQSTLGTSLVEVVLNWYANLSPGTITLLGNADATDVPSAVEQLRERLGAAERTLDGLRADLLAMTATGEPLAPAATALGTVYADCDAASLTATTTRAFAEILQLDAPSSALVYVPRLLAIRSLAEIDALTPTERAALLDPLGDSDGETLANWVELSAPPDQATSPQASDTDGDFITDDVDLCPVDPLDTCLGTEYGEMDTDGDGVVDAIDNCMNDANADQADANGDGIGDACLRYANILTPTSNVHVQIGASVEFTSIVTELIHAAPLTYLWDFAGAAPSSTAADPGPIQMVTPGTFTVSFTATDDLGNTFPADTRVLVVDGTPPTLDDGGPYFGTEGQAVTLTATATTSYGVIESYDWDFGDATTGTGNPTAHVWAQDATYPVSVTTVDSRGISLTDSTTATIADTVPSADFSYVEGVGGDPLTVAFTDESTAYDGVVGWDWDFGDGSANDPTQDPTHTFPVADLYTVTLTATDGDGSTGATSQDLFVGECLPAPADLVSWWPLDETGGTTAADVAGMNDGAHVGGPTPIAGNVEGALELDGATQYVEVAHDPSLAIATADFSIAAWIYPDTTTGILPIFSKRNDASGRGFHFYLSSGNVGLQLADGGTPVFEDYISSIVVPAGQWSFVAVTVDRDDPAGVRFYVDGLEPAVTFDPTNKQGSLSHGQPLRIGASQVFGAEAAEFFAGRLDEVELYGRVLTPHELAAIHAADDRGICKELCVAPAADVAAWWPLDETTPETSGDAVGGNDGTHSGCPAPVLGQVDVALGFDGADDVVTVPTAPALDVGTGDFTLEAWVRVEAAFAAGVRPVIDKRSGAALGTQQGYVLYLNGGVPTLQLADLGAAPGYTDYAAVASVADGLWHHVAATVDRDSPTGLKLFVDGAVVATHDPTLRFGTLDNTADVRLGASHPIPTVFRMRGSIDEVALYERALADEEVQDIHAAGALGKCKASVAADLVLTQTELIRGQVTTFTATGALPGETVYFARSPSTGCGPCIPAFGSLCVNLTSPTLLGTAVANGDGEAVLSFAVPAGAPLVDVSTQAVVQRGPGGGASVKSNTNTDTIQP